MRRRIDKPVDFTNVTLLLTQEQMQCLDGLSAAMRADRSSVLIRGLTLLGMASTALTAPASAIVEVSVYCSHDGAQMVRVPA